MGQGAPTGQGSEVGRRHKLACRGSGERQQSMEATRVAGHQMGALEARVVGGGEGEGFGGMVGRRQGSAWAKAGGRRRQVCRGFGLSWLDGRFSGLVPHPVSVISLKINRTLLWEGH